MSAVLKGWIIVVAMIALFLAATVALYSMDYVTAGSITLIVACIIPFTAKVTARPKETDQP